ncbi:MAG TPA: hypothetical protein VIS07_22020 [Candidatus Binatia bacterium]
MNERACRPFLGHDNRVLRALTGVLTAAVLTLVAVGCSDSDSSKTIDLIVEHPDRCDPLDQRHCLLPFPSNFFTRPDPSTDTGLRIHIERASAIRNKDGVHVDTTEWNRNDGFSPGSQISTFIPGIDLERTGLVSVANIGGSLAEDSPAVILDTVTGERIPYFSELDASVESDDARVLYIRPARNLKEGHRHVVALRRLRNANGDLIHAGDVFRAYRDRLISNVPEVEAQRDRFERIFADLEAAGVARDETLFLAWDFTVASQRNLTERMLHIRDDAFARLGDQAPRFTVDNVEENVDEFVARRVYGTFEVPLYLTGDGGPGTRFNYAGSDLPQVNGTYEAVFQCIVPHAALAGPNGSAVPARPSVYGHGLLGSEREVGAGNVRRMANEHNFVFCATKWIGMSEEDIGNAVVTLGDISNFPTMADRLQQGVLNTLFLGRLMIHRDGLVSHPAFQANGEGVIDRTALFYDGNSQGGIMGGIATAVSIDWTRAVLGVPAMNYSILLQRSVDWDTYRAIYDPAYPDEIERGIGILMLQMLWDRGEANGYALHMTDDPLPNTPPHTVLMHVAFGDHQVSPDAANIQARTIGARIHEPAVTPGRLPYVEPYYWGIEPIPSYPYHGSAIVIWDSGAPVPPLVNLPPREGEDSHEDPRADPEARLQKSEFLKVDGAVIDVCGGGPCFADPVR